MHVIKGCLVCEEVAGKWLSWDGMWQSSKGINIRQNNIVVGGDMSCADVDFLVACSFA